MQLAPRIVHTDEAVKMFAYKEAYFRWLKWDLNEVGPEMEWDEWRRTV